ncbi:uroporphyrinogen-III synthase [Aurantibacillus circumpalustris]|uniref:uroporphyrinogen-III synthase n=1 Tax=Aurantibacillus circumpalustris TaxID=3036359 RepID=UPI00295BFD05|nr:uroporphyrinogen-III synthase [Aurantibacillus circumpalustris]
MTISDVSFDKKSIFISRNLTPISPLLIKLNSMGYEVLNESLITVSQIRFTHTPVTKWIFFSSKNSIRHFFAQNPELAEGVKFAVMSPSSAEYLVEFGKTADFIGEGVDVTLIAKKFADFIKDDTVLFPQAIDSLQTIQRQLSFTNICHNLFVYKTTRRIDFEIPQSELLVFTSPSNAQAYLEKYKPAADQKFVAIGSTTYNQLKNYGIKNIGLPSSFDEIGLLNTIVEQLEVKVPSSKINSGN